MSATTNELTLITMANRWISQNNHYFFRMKFSRNELIQIGKNLNTIIN